MENGQLVSIHYIGTLDDGTEFDNSRSRNTPLEFQLGTNQVIPGFETAVKSMEVGETRDVQIESEEVPSHYHGRRPSCRQPRGA